MVEHGLYQAPQQFFGCPAGGGFPFQQVGQPVQPDSSPFGVDQRRLAKAGPALEQQHPAAAFQQLLDRRHLALALAQASHQAACRAAAG